MVSFARQLVSRSQRDGRLPRWRLSVRIGRRYPSRLHALRFVLRCLRLVVIAFPVSFPSPAWAGGRGAHRSPLVGCSPASVFVVSIGHPLAALTRQSRGTPIKRLFSDHAAPRGAPYFYVGRLEIVTSDGFDA